MRREVANGVSIHAAASVLIIALLTVACGGNPPPVVQPPHSEPIAHLGINAGPERVESVGHLAGLGPMVIRTAVQGAQQARDVLSAVEPYPGLTVLLLVEKPDLGLVAQLLNVKDHPQLHGVELVNEPELQGLTAQTWGGFVNAAYRQLIDGGWTKAILSGGLYTVDDSTVQYMRDANLPVGLTCRAWHFYGDWTDTVLAQMQQFGCAAITETGMPSRTPAEDQGQLAYLTEAKTAATRGGVRYFLIYQLASGPSTSNLDNFGLQRFDLTYKPAEALLK